MSVVGTASAKHAKYNVTESILDRPFSSHISDVYKRQGVDCVDTESHAGWKAFLSGLRARGVDGVRLVVSDAHEGLAKAIAETFQGAAWQRDVYKRQT